VDKDFTEFYQSEIGNLVRETIVLENGAEAYFTRSGSLDMTKRHPMIVFFHGGPFASAPRHILMMTRFNFLLQGYCLLVVNYRGSTGYGKKFMDELLGNAGEVDIEDCGNLALKAMD
jgi:dipeptidyl aminopeptidase/acylaminoacyl peptidase